jgi:hypothetical protein
VDLIFIRTMAIRTVAAKGAIYKDLRYCHNH